MTPDIRYTTAREGESSARIIKGMGKKLIQHDNSFQTSYTHKNYSRVRWEYSEISSLCDKPKQALIALISCQGNIWLLECRDMAI